MTDVYVAYAREDRDRLRLITGMLRFEGWDIWMDPSDLSDEPSPAAELKLASARVILRLLVGQLADVGGCSIGSCNGSLQEQAGAAAGRWRGPAATVRPGGVVDFAHWHGDIDDPAWRRLIASLKQHAGEPAGTRALPNTTRKVMAPPPSMPSMAPPSLSQPSQNRPPPALTPSTRPHQVFPPPQPAAPQAVRRPHRFSRRRRPPIRCRRRRRPYSRCHRLRRRLTSHCRRSRSIRRRHLHRPSSNRNRLHRRQLSSWRSRRACRCTICRPRRRRCRR